MHGDCLMVVVQMIVLLWFGVGFVGGDGRNADIGRRKVVAVSATSVQCIDNGVPK